MSGVQQKCVESYQEINDIYSEDLTRPLTLAQVRTCAKTFLNFNLTPKDMHACSDDMQ